ncbi:gamma-glutamylcyclotransferase family protein [Pseudaestuariivita atlantica]|uniref:Gamma-glutamylcyclotransferase AIG2-like domain-containing protein n=1 Tax=Pseudaestuariivita atlantica TaxID=1317121 RepID=A0A0L1JTH2_9RHOB|nr:gamma-glutamylcyclotransferase family protein [Pseudaestuariivita atlantica]KNG94987.1 hypothetical protein ATO11_06405 [Pseudaestuariivita atlantica]
MTNPRFFGFGSLVNTRTHDYPVTGDAEAAGWERVWVQTPDRSVTFLSARPAPGVAIGGLVCAVPGGDWRALDERESGYVRAEVAGDLGLIGPVAIYTTPGLAPAQDATRPILLSYLDVVIQGFADRGGVDSALRFFDTTTGWDVPVLDDRAAPRYPRHQAHTPDTQALVDAQLDRLGVARIRV